MIARPLEQAAEAITAASELTLVCHVGPDGDALGSMLAVAVAATEAGVKVYATFGEPFVVADTYRYLPLQLLSAPREVPASPEVMVCFDTASFDRLGELGAVADKAGTVVVVDHHVTNEGFGDIALIEPSVSSTAELTLSLIRRIGWPITPSVATCLLTGIVTDTGRFQYSNTGPRTLHAAAGLVAAGAAPDQIGRHVYEEVPFGYLGVASAVCGRAVLEPGVSMVWSVVRPDDLRGAGVELADVEGLIDLIRLAREAEVAVLVKDLEPGTVKASLRSRGAVDVGSIAARLGGGGHHNAAGLTFQGTTDEVMAAIRQRLPRA